MIILIYNTLKRLDLKKIIGQKGLFPPSHLLAKVIVANRKTTRNEFARFSFSSARLQTLTRAKNRGPSSLH